MRKQIDWNETEKRARSMTTLELRCARADAFKTAQVWSNPDTDPDGNAGFYMDQMSVYANEMKRRKEA